MSDYNIQQQLLQIEVLPPANAWEQIAVVLEEQEADEPLQQQLLSAEMKVPASAWDTIEERLKDQSLTVALNELTVDAPQHMWEQINAQLDAEADKAIVAQLKTVEEVPPVFVWQQIEQQLTEQEPAKLIPINRNYKPVYRLAIAAAITGVLAWGTYRFFNSSKETAAPLAVQTTDIPEKKNAAPVTVPERIIEPLPVEPDSRTAVRKKIKEELKLNNTVAYNDPVDHSIQTSITPNDIHHRKPLPVVEAKSFAEDQYFIVLNESGDLVRVSKKLSNLKCANISGTVPVDAAAALQSKDCDEQIKRWQQKMATAATLSASAGSIDLEQIILHTTIDQH